LFVLAQESAKSRLNRHLRAGFALALLGAAALTLAACGRSGPPEPPPGPALSAQPAAVVPAAPPGSRDDLREKQYEKSVQNGFDPHGNPVAPPGEKRSFFLDFLMQ
jgi:Prokaryotic lipoprotein-attachment site